MSGPPRLIYAVGKPLIEGSLAWPVASRNPLDVAGAWAAMVRAIRNPGRHGLVSCTISAADTALWDLKGQLRAGEWRMSRVKLKIGESWGTNRRRDLAWTAFARDVTGPDVELYVGASGRYARKQAVRIARRARMVKTQPVDCLQADMTRCGGITDWLRAAVAAVPNLRPPGVPLRPRAHRRDAGRWSAGSARRRAAVRPVTYRPRAGTQADRRRALPGELT